jgi:RNA polymerase sigma-70 factor, ECF subfamily
MTIQFADVYDEHVWRVYGFFAYRLESRQEAEDLTQQTFERALRAWQRFDARRAGSSTWLLSIARNLLIDHYRRGRFSSHQPLEPRDHEAVGGADAAWPGERLGVSAELAAGLASLTPQEREVLALRFGGDLPGPEIAELTGLSLGNVQQLMSRSLRKLRAVLEAPAEDVQPSRRAASQR